MSNAFDKPPKRVTRASVRVFPKISGFVNLGSYLRRVFAHPLRRLPKSVYDLARVWLGLALRRRLHLKRRIEHFSPRLVIGHIAAPCCLRAASCSGQQLLCRGLGGQPPTVP